MESQQPVTAQSMAPGWYQVEGRSRYWDGTRWIDDKRELKRLEKAQRDERRRQEKLQRAFEQALQNFWASPVGRARQAFEAGDHVFQYSIDVLNQQAIIVAMVGSTTSHQRQDPTAVLNAVCREGWELVNGDFVFVQQGQQSRDKFMSSGQNVAIKGTVQGYYLFKRCEQNREAATDEELRQRIWQSVQASQ